MNIKPLNDHVVLEPVDEETKTESGIVIPDTAEKERPVRGKVVAVGPGKVKEDGSRLPMSVAVGNTVLFKKYGPDEVEVENKTYLIAEESDILGIIE